MDNLVTSDVLITCGALCATALATTCFLSVVQAQTAPELSMPVAMPHGQMQKGMMGSDDMKDKDLWSKPVGASFHFKLKDGKVTQVSQASR